MRKKTIAILTPVGLGLYIVSYVAFFSEIPGFTFLAPVIPPVYTVNMLVGVLMLLAGVVLLLIGTINCLVKQAKQQQWAWFACTLFFGPICTLLWLIAVPEKQEPMIAVPMYVPSVALHPSSVDAQPAETESSYAQGYQAQTSTWSPLVKAPNFEPQPHVDPPGRAVYEQPLVQYPSQQ